MSEAGVHTGDVLPFGALTLPEHLYVHVPLCRSKCPYCDFYSLAEPVSASPGDIVAATMFSAVDWTRRGIEPAPLKSLYIGGGTPSMLGRYLRVFLTELRSLFPLSDDAEITVEANPDSLDRRLIEDLADVGVTRVSLGVQSLSEGALVWLGRAHDVDSAIEAMLGVVSLGMDLSVDLMCGIPAVNRPLWRAMLTSAVECGAGHVSVYPLTLEPGTPLASAVAAGECTVPDADSAADEMLEATAVLGGLGLQRYETANYAMPGKESVHNSAYWTGRPYLGIGTGAHGMLNGEQARATGLLTATDGDVARVRYEYGPGAGSRELSVETLTESEALREDAMLGLRMTEGISESLAVRAGVETALESLVADGLVEQAGGTWRTTERGWLLGNEVFGRVWTGA